MTAQEYYDLLIDKTKKELLPCYSEARQKCMYKYDGKECAFGLLIIDEKYQSKFDDELYTANDIINMAPDCFEKVDGFAHYDYNDVQYAHDTAAGRNLKNLSFKEIFIPALNRLECFRTVNKVKLSEG